MSHRYQVEVCFATWCPEGKGFHGATHRFTSKARAEAFARAISRYLPTATPGGCPLAWVLVSALAADQKTATQCGSTVCYLCFDPGAVVVKHHAIPRGFYGWKRPEPTVGGSVRA